MQSSVTCSVFVAVNITHSTRVMCVDTGRGLMAMKYFKPGEVIVSLPENLLITACSILNSTVGRVLRGFVTYNFCLL